MFLQPISLLLLFLLSQLHGSVQKAAPPNLLKLSEEAIQADLAQGESWKQVEPQLFIYVKFFDTSNWVKFGSWHRTLYKEHIRNGWFYRL